MEKQILRNFETFEEMPEGLLMLKEGSNLMYVRYDRDAYITREFFDSIISDGSSITYKVSYLNVTDNKVILTLIIKRSLIDNNVQILNRREDINIVPLNKILNIKGNSRLYISLEDINDIVNFQNESYNIKKK